jgi:hypothetical protein
LNWEATAAIGEIIGATVVVVTILYFAKQIRQNSQNLEVAALRDTTAQCNQWSELLVTTPDLAGIVVRGNESYHRLAPEEAIRYGAYIQAFFDNVESNRTLICLHNVQKDIDVLESIVQRRIRITGYYEWWSENTADYDDDSVRWVEDQRRTASDQVQNYSNSGGRDQQC